MTQEYFMKDKTYRNVLAELGYAQDEIDARIKQIWQAIFEDKTERFYFEDGPDTAYMMDTGNLDARTEGMSYGMMMAVQMDRQDIFDRLWTWSFRNMLMHDGPNSGYFAWSCAPDGTKNADGPAPDGEEYFALALFFAAERWGEREAPYDYANQARTLLHTCIHKGEDGKGEPMWDPENKLIKFIPNCNFTDPSYHLPHFYDIFAERANAEDRLFWQEAAAASRRFIPTSCHPVTGLNPEYSRYDGSPQPVKEHDAFYSDAYRVAINIGLDALWFGTQDWQQDIARRLHRFFADKDPADYREYAIDGTVLSRNCLHPVGLIASNAAAALASGDENAIKAVSLFWNTAPRRGDRRYYDNCLYFFSLLALSGRYRIC